MKSDEVSKYNDERRRHVEENVDYYYRECGYVSIAFVNEEYKDCDADQIALAERVLFEYPGEKIFIYDLSVMVPQDAEEVAEVVRKEVPAGDLSRLPVQP